MKLKWHYLAAAAIAVPGIAIGSTAAFAAAGNSNSVTPPIQKGYPAGVEANAAIGAAAAVPNVPLPTPTDPNLCGSWSNAALSSQTASVVNQYGALTGCLKIGDKWYLLASPSSGLGAIGTLACNGDATCLDGTKSHDATKFTWQQAPAGDGLSLEAVDGTNLILSDGTGNQFEYSTSTSAFLGK